MWTGITWEQKEALLKLSDAARLADSPIDEGVCVELSTRGLVRKEADGHLHLSRAGWEFLLPL